LTKKQGPLALIIIDGWGYSPTREGNAIALAAKPFYDELNEKYPRTLLTAHGTRVGLPDGVMGNSEVGHLNMGAGRVIRMDVSRIDHDIATSEFFSNEVLAKAMDDAKSRGRQLHLMGLISDGQVHSSQEHLYALLRMAKQRGVERVFIHCFLKKSAAAKLQLSSDVTTRWIATSAGKEFSALTICWLAAPVRGRRIQSKLSGGLTSAG